MASIINDNAKEYLLKLMVNQITPEELWIGLSYIDVPTQVTLDLLIENEPREQVGYKRILISSSDWIVEGISAKTDSVLFTNTSGQRWPPINVVFLATKELLISYNFTQSWHDLKQPRYLFPKDELKVPVDIKYN
jgi:hypothetical protein